VFSLFSVGGLVQDFDFFRKYLLMGFLSSQPAFELSHLFLNGAANFGPSNVDFRRHDLLTSEKV
jgi:hypothetical protein